ncbi:hypothetical protein E2I00_013965, partial [Balaenoptera physalus]
MEEPANQPSADLWAGSDPGLMKSSKKTEKKLAAQEEAKLASFMGVMNNMRKQTLLTSYINPKKTLCDMILMVQERKIAVHCVVLAAASYFLNLMFTTNMLELNMRISANSNNVQSLLDAANQYQIEPVKKCVLIFSKNKLMLPIVLHFTEFYKTDEFLQLDARRVTHLLNQDTLTVRAEDQVYDAACLDCPKLHATADDFIHQHFTEFYKTEFLQLDARRVTHLLNQDTLTVRAEDQVYDAAVRWLKYDEPNRQPSMVDILAKVRFPLKSRNFLSKTVEAEPLIQDNPKCLKMVIRLRRTGRRHKAQKKETSLLSASSIGAKPQHTHTPNTVTQRVFLILKKKGQRQEIRVNGCNDEIRVNGCNDEIRVIGLITPFRNPFLVFTDLSICQSFLKDLVIVYGDKGPKTTTESHIRTDMEFLGKLVEVNCFPPLSAHIYTFLHILLDIFHAGFVGEEINHILLSWHFEEEGLRKTLLRHYSGFDMEDKPGGLERKVELTGDGKTIVSLAHFCILKDFSIDGLSVLLRFLGSHTFAGSRWFTKCSIPDDVAPGCRKLCAGTKSQMTACTDMDIIWTRMFMLGVLQAEMTGVLKRKASVYFVNKVLIKIQTAHAYIQVDCGN